VGGLRTHGAAASMWLVTVAHPDANSTIASILKVGHSAQPGAADGLTLLGAERLIDLIDPCSRSERVIPLTVFLARHQAETLIG